MSTKLKFVAILSTALLVLVPATAASAAPARGSEGARTEASSGGRAKTQEARQKKACKLLKGRVDRLHERISKLEAKIAKLEARQSEAESAGHSVRAASMQTFIDKANERLTALNETEASLTSEFNTKCAADGSSTSTTTPAV